MKSRIVLSLLVLLAASSCHQDPRMKNLREGVEMMRALVNSQLVTGLVRKADPEMRPSTAVSAVFSTVVAASSPEPPEGIGFSPWKPGGSWIVVLRGDDLKGELIIEAYGDSLERPLIVKRMRYPPR